MDETPPRKPYPTDVTDEEWAFLVPYLTLMALDAPQRTHDLREVFNALRWIVRAGAPWRLLPTNFPPWPVVYRQTRRWIDAGCFEAVTHDLRVLRRLAAGRAPEPTAAVLDSRTVQSTPESGHRAGWDGAKRRKGTKTHVAVDTLGHLLALHVTPASAQDREQVELLAAAVQEATGQSVELGYVDQGYTGEQPAARRRPTGCSWRWSSCPTSRRASSCCRKGGSSSERSLGCREPAAWRATTSGCRASPSACTSPPASRCSSPAPSPPSPKLGTASRRGRVARRRAPTETAGCRVTSSEPSRDVCLKPARIR
jgi:transposase